MFQIGKKNPEIKMSLPSIGSKHSVGSGPWRLGVGKGRETRIQLKYRVVRL